MTDSIKDIKDIFREADEDFKKRHPIAHWVDSVLFGDKGLFGYAPHYSLTHPHVVFMDAMRQIKWAYQRVFRGWDDKVCWSIDYWLDSIMPDILLQYKQTNHGTSMFCYEDDTDFSDMSDEESERAIKKWNYIIDQMIAGFMASRQSDDIEFINKEQYDKEWKRLENLRKKGMKLFVEHYHDLWD